MALVAVTSCGSSSPPSSAGASSASAAAAGAGVRTLAPKDAAATLTGGRVVLDVRTPDEYAAGHLAGAKEIDFYAASFKAELGKLDKATPYLVYCHSGNRSGQASELMKQLGFTDVVDVQGGITAWTAAGLSIET